MTLHCLFQTAALVLFLSATTGEAQWTKTISCPAGDTYRDDRVDAGRTEYCIRKLPGELIVNDGPFHFWFSAESDGDSGSYQDGRQVGAWKECDRFGHCRHTHHDALFPNEKTRAGFKAEIPVRFENGNYLFDFASCRSTWINKTDLPDPVSLNIGGYGSERCLIAYLPQSWQKANGNAREYVCEVPYAVGIRAFDSIDLEAGMKKAGLPRFCWEETHQSMPIMIRTGVEEVVLQVDFLCGSITRKDPATTIFSFALNSYAAAILNRLTDEKKLLTTLLCTFTEIPGPGTADASGRFHIEVKDGTPSSKTANICLRQQVELPACQ